MKAIIGIFFNRLFGLTALGLTTMAAQFLADASTIQQAKHVVSLVRVQRVFYQF